MSVLFLFLHLIYEFVFGCVGFREEVWVRLRSGDGREALIPAYFVESGQRDIRLSINEDDADVRNE